MADFLKIPVEMGVPNPIFDYVGTGSPVSALPNAAPGSLYRQKDGGSGSVIWQKTASSWEAVQSSAWNQAAADLLYVKKIGDTMTGSLTIPSAFTTYTSDGLFNSNALPGLTVTTPGGGNRKLIIGYRDGGGGQYVPAIGFLAESTAFTNLPVLVTMRSADTDSRFIIYHDGAHYWGAGTSGLDTSLVRSAAATLAVSNNLQVGGYLSVTSTARLYLDGGGDTYINEDTANRIQFVTGGQNGLLLTAASATIAGDYILAPTKKYYLDGGGDTYIYESAANQLDFVVGSFLSFRAISNAIVIPALSRLYVDGGGDTYIYESAADTIDFSIGGAVRAQWTPTLINFLNGVELAIPATKKFYLDGGGDTYIYEAAANEMSFFVGASERFRIKAAGVQVPSGAAIYVDGGGDTWIYESAANVLDCVVGGVLSLRQTGTQVAVATGSHFSVEATKRVYVDGGSDTYLWESSANNLSVVAGASTVAVFNASGLTLSTGYLLGTVNKGVIIGNSFFGQQGGGYGEVGYNNNDGTGTTKYQVTDFASRIRFQAGGFSFQTASSGTAGASITFTERASLTAGLFTLTSGVGLLVNHYITVGVSAGNGYIYYGTDTAYYIQRADATWGTGNLYTNGSYRAASRLLSDGATNATGQLRATGWWVSGDSTGLGAELGISSGQAYLYSYNRTTSAYGVLNIGASEINLIYSGGPAYLSDGTTTKQRLAAIVISSSAPSGTAPTGTIWFQY